MKDKKLMITSLIALGIIVIGIIVYFLVFKSKSQIVMPLNQSQEQVIPTITADSLGIELIPSDDKHRVKFIIHNITGIEDVEYEAFYNAISNGNTVLQGFNGQITKDKFGADSISSDFRELGTCSTGGKCRFDEGVTSIKFTFKITKDGAVYQSEKTLQL